MINEPAADIWDSESGVQPGDPRCCCLFTRAGVQWRMPLFAIVVGLGIFGAMVYLVLSKKTDRRIRVVALVALGVMILAVIVCAALIFWGSPGAADEGLYLLDETAAASETAGNSFVIIAFILFLIALFVIVLIFLMRNLRAEKAGK